MNESAQNWQPDPQLLAAYFDGELEARADCADVRARVEAWLEVHPEAAADWAKHRKLQSIWLDTTPAEPGAATWNRLLDGIDAKRRLPAGSPHVKRPWWTIGVVAASVALFVSVLFGVWRSTSPTPNDNTPIAVAPKEKPRPPDHDDVDVFPVATADEITIFRVSGADTDALVVGRLPLSGPLVLADAGEVHFFTVRPDADDQMMPTVRQKAPHRPMIWAPLETE